MSNSSQSSCRTSALGRITRSRIIYNSLMFFIAYTFKGQEHVFAGRVKIVSQSSFRTSTILKYFCPLLLTLHTSHREIIQNIFYFRLSSQTATRKSVGEEVSGRRKYSSSLEFCNRKLYWPKFWLNISPIQKYNHSFLASSDFCCLMINFANSLDPDQYQQTDPFDSLIVFGKNFLKKFILKKKSDDKLHNMQRV